MNKSEWNELKERLFRDFPDLCWCKNVEMRRKEGERYGMPEEPEFDAEGNIVRFPWEIRSIEGMRIEPIREILGLCACGDPELVIGKFYYPFLKAINTVTDWVHSHSLKENFKKNNDELISNLHAALSGERVNDTFFKIVDDQTLEYLVLYVLNDKGLTEHGTSIGGCWITDKGKTALMLCEAVLGNCD